MVLTVLKLLGCIALLMYGMKVMSEALQKMAGPGLRHILGAMTTNRFTGVLTGLLTCVAQSSAALMAITMVLCTSGVLTIYQGIALVMGENIGTTITANVAALSANTQARRAGRS